AGSSTMTMSWTFFGSGDVVVDYTLSPDATMAEIPTVGTLMSIPGGFETLRWFGRGPHENYIGRNRGSYVGHYSAPVDSTITLYTELSETGQRTDVRWAALTNSAGLGLLAVGSPNMEINAQHHTPAQLTSTRYPWDLTRQSDISFRIDFRQMGLGGVNSWGAKPLDAHMNFANKTYKHSFRLSPIKSANQDLEHMARMGFKNLATSDSVVDYQILTTSIQPGSAKGRIEVVGLGHFLVEDMERVRSVEVVDMAGRRLRTSAVSQGRAVFAKLNPGLYVLRFLGVGFSRSSVVSVAR
ncbi:MAG: beta-galactosidase small subunit, partial [Fibrobacterota bacterium]